MSLLQKSCVPCRGGVPAVSAETIERLSTEIPGWEVVNGHHLRKTYTFPDFLQALAFVNRVGAVAESEGHHPDLELKWGKVGIITYTHAIDGLTENDFILAAKIDREYQQ